MKLHMQFSGTEKGMPDYLKSEFLAKGERGALCGYMAKTTTEKTKVTCSYCLRLLKAGH